MVAELSVHFGTVEAVTVHRKNDALDFIRLSLVLKSTGNHGRQQQCIHPLRGNQDSLEWHQK